MESKRTATTYFIPPGKFLLLENALGNPDLIQSSVSSDCRVTIVDKANFPLDELEQWPTFRLTSSDIKLKLGNGKYYIYIVVPTPDNAESRSAFISYNTRLVDRDGYEVVESTGEDGSATTSKGDLLGKVGFKYYICGTVSARGGNPSATTVPSGQGRLIEMDLGVTPVPSVLPGDIGDWDKVFQIDKVDPSNPNSWMLTILSTVKEMTARLVRVTGALIFGSGESEKKVTDVAVAADKDDKSKVSDTVLASTAWVKSKFDTQFDDLDKRFLSKLHHDRTPYKLNVGDLFTAEKDARLHGKTETDDVTVNEAVHSKEFVSGFTGGKGWAIRFKEYLNSAGVTEKRAVGEFDDLIIRGTMRVFEFIVSQMLGENDNRTFTGMMKVDHYDPSTGRVWLDTQDGKLYNTFRKDDIILVQQYNGMPSEENDFYIVKQYELIIDEVGVGDLSLGEDRLDWVTFRNFASPLEGAQVDIITKGDTFVRIDNLTDSNRKGIIQVMTVGEDTPYMDVIYGKKTEPENALKSRFGNLQGVYNHLFGWLKDFGAYIANLYAVGEFRIAHTGEDVADKIEMVKSAFRTNFSRTYFEMKDGDNHLMNGSFGGDLEGWTLGESSTDFLTVDGMAIYANRNLMTANTKFVGRSVYNDKNMLRILNSDITQPNTSIRKFGTHKEYVPMDGSETSPSYEYVDVRDKAYLIMRFFCDREGTVEVGFDNGDIDDGSLRLVSMDVVKRTEEYLLQAEGIWNNDGNFVIRSTADIYVEFVTLTEKPLENLTTTTETWMEQDAGRIALLGQKIDKSNESITNLGIELDATNEQLRLYANKTDENTVSISQLKIDVDSIDSAVVSVQGDAEKAKELAEAAEDLAVTATMTGMYSGEEYNQTSNPWNSWTANTEYKHVGAIWYNPNTGVTKRYVGTDGSNSWETVSDAEKVYASATYVFQNKNKWSAIAAQFDEDGDPLLTSGFVTTGNFATMFSEALDAETDLVHRAEISVFITENEVNEKISNIKLTADNVDINNGVVVINSNSAKIGGFTVYSDRLENNAYTGSSTSAYISIHSSDNSKVAYIGAPNEAMGYFRNDTGISLRTYSQGTGTALKITAQESSLAMDSVGRMSLASRYSSELITVSGLALAYKYGNDLETPVNPSIPITSGMWVDFLVLNGNLTLPNPSNCHGKLLFVKCTKGLTLTVPDCVVANASYTSYTKEEFNNDNHMRAFFSAGSKWFELNLTNT